MAKLAASATNKWHGGPPNFPLLLIKTRDLRKHNIGVFPGVVMDVNKHIFKPHLWFTVKIATEVSTTLTS
jgi:hypothetical protein